MGYAQNSLTTAIYEMALGRGGWENILDILHASFPQCAIFVAVHELTHQRTLVFSQRGISPTAVPGYLSTYASQNPWLPNLAELAPFQVYHDDQLLPREHVVGTPFYKDWLIKQGDFSAATGVVVLREGARQMLIEIRYPAQNVAMRERAAAMLGEAAHHFGRAFEIIRRSRFSAGQGYLDNVVEDLPFTMFFVDQEMRIHYSNQHAHAMRRKGDGPFSGVEGILRASDEEADRQLRAMVQKIALSKRSPTSVLQLTTPGRDERYLAIARLATRGQQHHELHDTILDPSPLVMLVVHGSLDASNLPIDLLWRAFGLTEAEGQLAEALLKGATLANFAQEREVSKQTLRNQLVGVMRKTGTRRQSDLISLLTRLALTC